MEEKREPEDFRGREYLERTNPIGLVHGGPRGLITENVCQKDPLGTQVVSSLSSVTIIDSRIIKYGRQ